MKESSEKIIMQKIDKKEGFVLILFSTPTCGKCKLAEEYLEQVLPQLPEFPVFKCVVDYNPEIVEKYQVSSAPSFKLFMDGELVQTLFGLRSSDDLYYTIKNYVKDKENYDDVWATLLANSDAENNNI